MSDGTEAAIILLPHEKLVQKMAVDMYIGEGKDNPPIVTRVALLEDGMETVKDSITEIKDTHKANQKLIIGTLISSVGGLLVMLFELLKATH